MSPLTKYGITSPLLESLSPAHPQGVRARPDIIDFLIPRALSVLSPQLASTSALNAIDFALPLMVDYFPAFYLMRKLTCDRLYGREPRYKK